MRVPDHQSKLSNLKCCPSEVSKSLSRVNRALLELITVSATSAFQVGADLITCSLPDVLNSHMMENVIIRRIDMRLYLLLVFALLCWRRTLSTSMKDDHVRSM